MGISRGKTCLAWCFLLCAPAFAGPEGAATSSVQDSGDFYHYAAGLSDLHKERLISPVQLLDMMKDPHTVIIDVRDVMSYAASHIKGAKNYSPFIFSDEAFQKLVPDKDTRVILYCDNGVSYLSSKPPKNMMLRKAALATLAFPYLYKLGYHNLYELQDGLKSIKDNGAIVIPMESGDLDALMKEWNRAADK